MRRLLAVAILLAGLVGAADAGARTTVTVNGTEIVIHVPIQLAGLKGRTMRNPITGERYDDAQLADFIAKESESFWNEGATGADEFFGEKPSGGLSKLRYGDCFTIRIEVEIVPTAVVEGGKQVRLEGYHYVLFDNNPNGKMIVWDPATSDPTKDTSSAYTQSLDGEWTGWEDYFGGGGHEIGHLLGLGDDYNDQGALPGREGTVMDHGRKFDQNIVDRIVDLVRESGVELPECWTGTVRAVLDTATCFGVAEGSMKFVVADDRSIRGSGKTAWTRLERGCIGLLPAELRVSGTRTDDALELVVEALGPYGSKSPPISVPVRGNTARATIRRPEIMVTETYDLKCESCEGTGDG